MNFKQLAIHSVLLSTVNAFVPPHVTSIRAQSSSSLSIGGTELTEESILEQLKYKPGKAKTQFAEKYGALAGRDVKTVGDAFADFTKTLGFSINALYKNAITDLVGTTHLIVVNARFQRDPIWSAGILLSIDLLLKNYPERDVGEKIASALFTSVGLDEALIRAEATEVIEWARGKTKEEVAAALRGEGDSAVAKTAQLAKSDEFWMYSRYFGLGLVKILEVIGYEMDKDEVYPVIEDWMSTQMGKSHITACADSDLYFRVKDKLDMMETMMKEIEIREKKRLAERLELKAEAAIRAAERDAEYKREVAAEQTK